MERLRELGLLSLGKKGARGKLINVYTCLMAGCKEETFRLFSFMPFRGTGGSGHGVKHRKFYLNIRIYLFFYFTVRGVAYWNTVQGCCIVSILGRSRNTTGHIPGQLSFSDLERGG